MTTRTPQLFWLLLILTAMATATYTTLADEKPKTSAHQPAKLLPALRDDFSKDTRGAYTIHGDVSWEEGKLTLGTRASIERAIDAGAWAKIELDVELPELTAQRSRSDLRVWFLFDGAADCLLRVQTMLNDGRRAASFTLIEVGERDGQLSAWMVRRTHLDKFRVNQLTVEYRYGLVKASVDGKSVLVAHIGNGSATVAGCRVTDAIRSTEINRLKAWCTEPAGKLSPQQEEQFSRAKAAKKKMVRLYRQGKFDEAAQVGGCAMNSGCRSKSILPESTPLFSRPTRRWGPYPLPRCPAKNRAAI